MDYISFYSNYLGPLPALLAGLYSLRYLRGGLKWMFWYVCFATVSQWTSRVVVWFGYYNVGLLHFYVPLEFLLLTIVYIRFLDGFIRKRIILIIMVSFLVFSVVDSLTVTNFHTYHSYGRAISSILLSIYAIMLYMKMINELKIRSLSKDPEVWINTSVFLYFSGSFFVFITFSALLNLSWAISKAALRINTFLGIIFYILIAVGFLTAIKNHKERILTAS